ncbi:MAG: hypothetical protein F4057_02010 [Acidobacteria bacterium]|nr:hypothetical protein [Acidobacteriota bacterium]MYI74131.1 hypothetical protein [Acidobacteriota bacterium]
MRYLVVLHTEPERTDYGVTVPDLPGCTSAGDTLDDALKNAEEAIRLYLEVLVEDGGTVPAPTREAPPLEPGEIVGVVDLDLDKMEPTRKAQRLNVSIPGYAIAMIDDAAKRAGTSRSGFLTRAALAVIERNVAV